MRTVTAGFFGVLLCVTSCSSEQEYTLENGKADHTAFDGITEAVDILFVVDNSGSMQQEQANLRRNFPKLIESLRRTELGPDGSGKPCSKFDRSGCKIPDVHIGVVSSDLGAGNYGLPSCEKTGGDGGTLLSEAMVNGCNPPNDPFISYVNGQSNVPGAGDEIEKVTEAFSCIAALGVGGCGFEQPLEAARLALDPKTNPGFIRQNALLAIVFLTDEDDCSASDPVLFDPDDQGPSNSMGPLTSFRCFDFGIECDINDRDSAGPRENCVPKSGLLHDVNSRYIDYFSKLKPAGRVIVEAIAAAPFPVEVGSDGGTPSLNPSCESADGIGVPAIRLAHVVAAFGSDGHLANICDDDFGPALTNIGSMLQTKMTPPMP